MATPGRYKGKGIEGPQNKGGPAWTDDNDNKTLQLVVGLELWDADCKNKLSEASTFLPFTEKAAPYSVERLRALGWEGKGPSDLANLSGLSKNWVDVEVKEEDYKGKKMIKVEIVTGGGRFKVEAPIDPKIAAARVAAMMGGAFGGGSAPAQPANTESGFRPPF